ncbi:YqiJ family protein [Bradyrhizobium sp. CCGUVB1N3]|uniref:OB-fold-containig protein n=1 Tax=Bradyrhizobium sp. CCGUVB1N3 TaxID=2949629 RepID=UPI0020B251C4|nr:OB-fold-containig protein [Bradyrhizobium sp. CCGUVB1N3]MCP3469897.1 YqiJ family protein [Bradyrhizobium sp. CCGUVB1N3]
MSTLLEHVMAPEVRPFAIAAAMIVIVGSVEVVSMMVGASISEMLGTNIDFGHPSDNGVINAISWINLGGVPLLIFLLLLLGAFSITGFLIQDIARMVAGPLPASVASLGAGVASIPLVRISSGFIARIIPKDESYAVGLGDLVGRVGEVVIGPLDQGPPGRVSVADVHGNRHFVWAVAAPSSEPLVQGSLVLLVDRVGTRFVAVKADDELKPSKPTLSNQQSN